jgi:hypothetical protein
MEAKMGTAITVRNAVDLQALISSPELLALRRISMGTVQHPGMSARRYLSGGLTLTAQQRATIAGKVAMLRSIAESDDSTESQKSRLAIIANMLLVYPIPGASEESGRARAQAYLIATADVPPWAVAEAVNRWHQGKCGPDHNYRFAPAPAELREACMAILQPAKQMIRHLQDVLDAMTLERAMDPAPIESAPTRPRLQVMR